jgi:hypothetical protein
VEDQYGNDFVERRINPMKLDPDLERMIRETHAANSEVILLLKDKDIGLCSRVKGLEKTVNGNGSPGLAEQVRNIQSSNAKVATVVAGSFTVLLHIVFEWMKKKMGAQ